MLTRVIAGWTLLLAGVAAPCATTPIYFNNEPVQSPPDVAPQIDATAFVNRSLFSINTYNLPYETLNTLFFTNTGSGTMYGDPGYRFRYSSANLRLPMDSWVNQGQINAQSDVFFFSGASANWLLISATNIISTGPLSVGSQGLLRLEGNNINLRRTGLRSGNALTNSGFLYGTDVLSSNYFNDVGITDIYWGAGSNNVLAGAGQPMDLTGFGLDALTYTLPFPQSPYHQVIDTSFGTGTYRFTNTVSVPSFFGFNSLYDAVVYTNRLGPTNFSIQVVFYPTNSFDTNFSRQVRFYPEFGDGGATVVVGFLSTDFDIISRTYYTNSLYLIDALAYQTNVFLARNYNTTTRRPNTYDVMRNAPYFFSSFFATNGNASYTNALLYNPATYLSNRVNVLYAGYQAQVSSVNAPSVTTPSGALSDPTNFPGRIEILGDQVNLEQTRIRADSTLVLRAGNLASNQVAQIDAPYLIFDVGSTNPLLVISNVAPDAVRRLNGTISAWSGTWRNYETNVTSTNLNAIDFHVLIVEDNLQSLQPVVVSEFNVRGRNVLLADIISVGKSMKLDMAGLDLQGELYLPGGSSWAASNVLNLVNFTNRGVLSLQGSANFGTDRPQPYSNYVNSGTISAASHFIRSGYFENRGSVSAGAGLLSVDALQARLLGAPTVLFTNIFTNIFFGFTNVVTNIVTNSFGAQLSGRSDIQICADDLVLSNALLQAGVGAQGGLFLCATNRLVDAGLQALNLWVTTAGFDMRRRPAISDLLGTEIRTVAAPFAEAVHAWAAEDRGATPDGYVNNLALGKLVLNAQSELSLLAFTGNGTRQALYVDYLLFENYAADINTALSIAPNLTIYFADANLSAEKLDGALGGRLRWVPTYTGPYSSTNLLYGSGQVVTLNRALVTSKDRDDDYDGIVNSEDPEPVLVPQLSLVRTNTPSPRVVLSWDSAPYQTNRVLYHTSLTSLGWRDLTSVVNGSATSRLRVQDPIPAGTQQKYYQIRVDPP